MWCALLVSAVCAVFWRVQSFEFVHYDDLEYLLKHPYVRQGLSGAGVVWAFTESQVHNWHPLTTLSYLLDAELWGMTPGAFHAVNVALHAANTLLLFGLLRRWTGRESSSGIVAALFALHPLHVESVAWVAERKDVLSTLFFLLTLWAYTAWVARPAAWRYARIVLAYALGLMSKPMLVTLPFVLLLLDHWPLGRIAPDAATGRLDPARLARLVREKLPLFAMAAAASTVTYLVQRESGALTASEPLTLLERLANAALSYLRYLGMLVWPAQLGVLYPLPARIDLGEGALAGVLVLALSAAAVRAARRMPYLFTGWFWYVGTLVPVIGVVQVGVQSHADRYTYVPLIGIFVAVVWAAAAGLEARPRARTAAALVAGVVVALLSVRSWFQVGTWRDSETLYENALAVAPDSSLIHYNLATLLWEHGRHADAVPHLRESVRLAPDRIEGWTQLVVALTALGDLSAAEEALVELRGRAPDRALTHFAAAALALERGDLEVAEREATAALASEPKLERARVLLRKVHAARKARTP